MEAPVLLALAAALGAGLGAGLALLWARRRTSLPRQLLTASQHVKAAQAQLAVMQQQLAVEQAILDRLPDPMVILDEHLAVRRANAAAQAAFGAGLSAVLRHPAFRTALDGALADGRDQEAELGFAVPSPMDLRATVMVFPGPDRLVAILSDRTRDRAVERMRADFVANASHELRTPLASVLGFIETLQGPAADDRDAQTRFLAIMEAQAQRMNRLIDDLLSLSRIELTEHQPPTGRVDLGGLARRMAAGFAPQLATRQMTLALDIAPAPPALGDEGQLEQVVQNLLDNAVKYGRDGGTVWLGLQPAPQGPPWPAGDGVLLSVRDDGPGVARIHVGRLTERFYRADTVRSRAAGGTGLGLSIVKHIANRHRGRLVIDSTEGQGITVALWLPAG